MRTVLAIDGGQSGTTAVLGAVSGAVLGVGHGGPIRHHAEADADDVGSRSVRAAVVEAIADLPADAEVEVCCVSMTGSSDLVGRVLPGLVDVRRLDVLESDAMAALASGTGGTGGLALIAGTGSVALAVNARNETVVRGGWGWLMGDDGSGYRIAVEALRAAARAEDGTGPTTSLRASLPPRFGLTSLREVYDVVTAGRVDRAAVASLARDVARAADAGDAVAQGILDAAADALCTLVLTTKDASPALSSSEQVVVLSGGVLRPGGRVAERLSALLASVLPDFRVVQPRVPPVAGALYLALRSVGVVLDDLRRRDIEDRLLALGAAPTKHVPFALDAPGGIA